MHPAARVGPSNSVADFDSQVVGAEKVIANADVMGNSINLSGDPDSLELIARIIEHNYLDSEFEPPLLLARPA